eukprot:2731240-Rhodomonas_salina.2
MSGTGVVYGAICLRVCYAMSGTAMLHAAMRLRGIGTQRVYGAACLRARYVMLGGVGLLGWVGAPTVQADLGRGGLPREIKHDNRKCT